LKSPLTLIGALLVILLILMAIFAPLIAPYNPNKISLREKLVPPSFKHLFGTDEVGRDLLSRVIYGSRISLQVGIVVVLLSGIPGILIGAFSGYYGGQFDNIIMRLMDIIMAFPPLVLALSIAAALGPSLVNSMMAVAFIMIPKFSRLVRGETLSLKEKPFVLATRAQGGKPLYIIFRHIIPNSVSSVIVLASLVMGDAILVAASLSFIGLGAQPPTPEWGALVSVGRKYILDQWWYATFPGLFIFFAVMGFNLFGDGLRDILDPKIRGR
jgi:peptide/nickel transport system permease protein